MDRITLHDRVLLEKRVIVRREVSAVVGPATLFARDGGAHDQFCTLEQIAGLAAIAIETLISDPGCCEFRESAAQFLS